MDYLPFQTINETQYKLFGIVTNMDWEGGSLIDWRHERCGKSEEAHAVMKEDLAGGKLPSGKFGENAAWWWIMVLAHNLNAAMKSLVLARLLGVKENEGFRLINLPGRVMEHAWGLIVRLSGDHPSFTSERSPEDHGAWLRGIRVKTQKQIDASGCLEEGEGGVSPKLALRRA